jgi:hypothetical protein
MKFRIEIARVGDATSETPALGDSSAPATNLAGIMANNTVLFEAAVTPVARLIALQPPTAPAPTDNQSVT